MPTHETPAAAPARTPSAQARPARTPPAPTEIARHWRIDPALCYLNHGSFGACTDSVLEAQSRYRDRIERDAVSFYCRDMFPMLDLARKALASLCGGDPEDYVFVSNATTGVATVLDNMQHGVGMADPRPIGEGDELLAASIEYPACVNNLERLAERTGARVVRAVVPIIREDGEPVRAQDIIEPLLAAVTDRTRVCLLSHIFSAGGFACPAREIVAALAERGVTTIVDGAHAPGGFELDIPSVGAPFYTANCHKWLGAPKGAAFLWVRRDLQASFRPMVLSNYAHAPEGTQGRSRYNLEFDYAGTDDPTAYMAIADAVAAGPEVSGMDWPSILRRNRELALRGRDIVCERLGIEPPIDDSLLGPMAVIPLPDAPAHLRKRPSAYADALQDELVKNWKIQIPIWSAGGQMPGQAGQGRRLVRLSAQLYNTEAQYEYLAEALEHELAREAEM